MRVRRRAALLLLHRDRATHGPLVSTARAAPALDNAACNAARQGLSVQTHAWFGMRLCCGSGGFMRQHARCSHFNPAAARLSLTACRQHVAAAGERDPRNQQPQCQRPQL